MSEHLVYPELPDDVEATLQSDRRSDAEKLLGRLSGLGWTIGVAESLTGGLLVAELVAVPGASRTVNGGVVTYATSLKHSLLHVDASLLAAHGAVHPEVARQMAEGARHALAVDGRPADIGLSTTGIAGPDSPDGQPVGTVHIGVATALGTRVHTLALGATRADRRAIRGETVKRALRVALEAL